MKLPAAVIFDVDGTLADSERDGHRPAFNQAFAEAGLPYIWSVAEYGRRLATTGGFRRLRGFLVEQGHPDDEAEELARQLHKRKTTLFRAACEAGEVPSRPGAGRLIEQLGKAGVPVAVATTGRRNWVAPLLDRLFGLDRFVHVLTGDDVGEGEAKPDPAVYVQALHRLGTTPQDTVAVEDSRNGLDAAVAAELPCLVVVNHYTVDQELSAATLVTDAFGGPGTATVLAGAPDALDGGMITPATLGLVLAGRH